VKAHKTQLLTIEELVNQVLLDLGYGAHYKELFLAWGVRYYKKYRTDIAREFRKVMLDMTPWKAIVLPNDCVDPILIGVPNGQSFDLFVNKKLNPRSCACDDDEPTEPVYESEQGSEGVQYNTLTERAEDPGKLYGLASKDNGLGYFEINHEQDSNEIQLSANVRSGTRIMLIYLPTLFDPDRDNCIHPYAQPMIEAAIHWEHLKMKRRAGNRNISGDMIREAKDEYDERLCELAEKRSDLTSDMIIEISRDSFRLSPKH
jgi:hypothetical protein